MTSIFIDGKAYVAGPGYWPRMATIRLACFFLDSQNALPLYGKDSSREFASTSNLRKVSSVDEVLF